jgi:hypothetical protein
MEVKDKILGVGRRIDREREGYVVDCVLVSVLMPSSGIQQLLVVEEARRPDKHETILFDACVGEITLHFEGPRRSTLLPVVIHQHYYYNIH